MSRSETEVARQREQGSGQDARTTKRQSRPYCEVVEGERFPSALPEAFECAGCRYELRAVVPVGDSVVCPECGRKTEKAVLGTLLAARPWTDAAKSLCGPTAAFAGAAVVICLVAGGNGGANGLLLVIALVLGLGVPPIFGWSVVQGRKDRRWRMMWFCKALVLAWIVNIACVIGGSIICLLVRPVDI